MPPVLPQVGRDAMRTRCFTRQSRRDWIRLPASSPAVTGFAQGCDVINVNSQLQHGCRLWFSILRIRNLICAMAWGSDALQHTTGAGFQPALELDVFGEPPS
jgi:hypothetical protein